MKDLSPSAPTTRTASAKPPAWESTKASRRATEAASARCATLHHLTQFIRARLLRLRLRLRRRT